MTTALHSSTIELAREVETILGSLEGELTASANPSRTALRHLQINRDFWTEIAYHDQAFGIWKAQLSRDPEDAETVHHLAIMHHARAIDLEAGPAPRRSDSDWEAAVGLWYRLWMHDEFWDRIADIACRNAKRDPVDALRRRLPELVLGIHYDIAFDVETPNYRAQYHVQQASRSSFPKETLEAVRRATYHRWIADLPSRVWQASTRDPETIRQGSDRIEAYLSIDPGCCAALEDALRLQNRLVQAWYTDFTGAGSGDSTQRRSLLEQAQGWGEHWQPYFAQLLDRSRELEDDIRSQLSTWYFVMGEALAALDREPEAVPYYENGAQAGPEGDPFQKRCRKALPWTLAYIAREKVVAKDRGALTYCNSVARRDDLTLQACSALAQAFLLLDEFDRAEEICERGLSQSPDESEIDFREIEEFERGRRGLAELKPQIGIRRAQKLIQDKRHAQAVPILDRAVEQAPEEAFPHFLLVQCHLALDDPPRAAWHLRAFKTHAKDESARTAAADLENVVQRALTDYETFGPKGLLLRREAIQASNDEDFPRANELLKQAEAAVNPAGREKIREERASVLQAWAVRDVNEMQEKRLPLRERAALCRMASNHLVEASRLDPENATIAQNVKTLEKLEESISKELAFIDQFGGERAAELRSEAVKAYNEDRHDEAIRLLREALAASNLPRSGTSARALDLEHRTIARPWDLTAPPGPSAWVKPTSPRLEVLRRISTSEALGLLVSRRSPPNALEKELSQVLAAAAVAKVNRAGPSSRIKILADAAAMLAEACELDPDNRHAKTNLEVISNIR